MIDGQKRSFLKFQDVRGFLDSVLDEDIHTKRVDCLANATLGVMTGASLGVALIGKSLAQARGLLPKHAIKQVDRLLSNRKLEAWDLFATWVPELVGSRTDLIVAMDCFDADGQATLALKLVTRHKGNTRVGATDGTVRPAEDWVGQSGRARKLRDATVTEAHCPVGAAVCVHAKGMKEPWCLVTGSRDATAPQIIKLYSKRWTVEPS